MTRSGTPTTGRQRAAVTIAFLHLNAIGPAKGGGPERRPWVARLLGLDPKLGYVRTFVEGRRDHGVVGKHEGLFYAIETGTLYEVQRWRTRYKDERYFVRVDATGEIAGVPKATVDAILREAECTRDETIRQKLATLDPRHESVGSTSAS
jgi:hypothetical protein